jgi:hypothetical protein
MPRYTIIFRHPECEKELPIKYDGLKDDTPAKIRQRNPTFERMCRPIDLSNVIDINSCLC